MIDKPARRLLPRSLFGQTLLILLLGLVVSHALGAWIYQGAREQAVRAIGGFAAAQRVSNLSRLIDEAPTDWRPRLMEALSDPTFRVALSAQPPGALTEEADGPAQTIRDLLLRQLPDWPDRQVRVAVAGSARPAFAPAFGGPPNGRPMGGMMRDMMGPDFVGPGFGAWRTLQAVVKLRDGQWLSFTTALPQSGPAVSWQFVIAMVLMGLIVLVVSAWAVRSVTAPLGALAGAADRLGRDVAAPPLPETGAVEMQTAARAFNRMQERLRRLIESRTQMLAALSHDLRTPLTLLRLRTEDVPDDGDRERMLATIGDMDAMIGSTLAFARDEVLAEPRRRVDVAALLASVVDDMADAGLPVTMTPAAALTYECQSVALKRAITNLLDNAVKYGKRANAGITATRNALEIAIDDEGPGIAENEIPRVFQPFYRIEGSRNRDTGGTGLGLAIAQSVAQAHGGEVMLANRSEGGLRARIRLPIQ